MNVEHYIAPGMIALVALIAAGWRQVRATFESLQRLVVVTTRLDPQLAMILSRYLEAHAPTSRTPRVGFTANRMHVRPRHRVEWVAQAGAGEPGLWFWRGRPIRMVSEHVQGTYDKFFTLTYIRGTFDLRQLLADACSYVSNMPHRHEVRVLTGRETDRRRNGRPNVPQDELLFDPGVICGWSAEDIGDPLGNVSIDTMWLAPELRAVYDEMRVWLANREWYTKRGVAWRYSALLYGPPGTGKTSFVRAAAQSLDMPIIVLDLASMSNEELTDHWKESTLYAPCIILIEDIDRIFDMDNELHSQHESKVLTFDRLLNCMAGVGDSQGVVTVITANDVSRLDPALTRPGRLDSHVLVPPLTPAGKVKIAARILEGYPLAAIDVVAASPDGETAAAFERRCQEIAVRMLIKGQTIA